MTLNIVRRLIPEWGTTYGPPGDGPFPAILVLHGSEGGWSGWSHRNAVLLAAHGYLAFPLSYSQDGNVWNAGQIRDIPLERTQAALEALSQFAPCRGQPLGIYGASRGAEQALLLSSLLALSEAPIQPNAIAAHSPADVVCGAFDARTFRDHTDPGWQAWDAAAQAWTWQGEGLKPTTPIEVEKIEAPIFLSHGTADRVWSFKMTERLQRRLQQVGKTPEVHFYEGQDHIPNSEGENDHHQRLIAFFDRHLKNDR